MQHELHAVLLHDLGGAPGVAQAAVPACLAGKRRVVDQNHPEQVLAAKSR
jgi:hypothetical protein